MLRLDFAAITQTILDIVALRPGVAIVPETQSRLWLLACGSVSFMRTIMPCVRVETPNKVGREVTNHLSAEMRSVRTCLLPLPSLSLSFAKVSSAFRCYAWTQPHCRACMWVGRYSSGYHQRIAKRMRNGGVPIYDFHREHCHRSRRSLDNLNY